MKIEDKYSKLLDQMDEVFIDGKEDEIKQVKTDILEHFIHQMLESTLKRAGGKLKFPLSMQKETSMVRRGDTEFQRFLDVLNEKRGDIWPFERMDFRNTCKGRQWYHEV